MEEVEQLCNQLLLLIWRVIASGTKDELKNMITLGERITIELK